MPHRKGGVAVRSSRTFEPADHAPTGWRQRAKPPTRTFSGGLAKESWARWCRLPTPPTSGIARPRNALRQGIQGIASEAERTARHNEGAFSREIGNQGATTPATQPRKTARNILKKHVLRASLLRHVCREKVWPQFKLNSGVFLRETARRDGIQCGQGGRDAVHHHNVHVVLLDSAVGKIRKVQAENPNRDPKRPCIYEGMMGLTPRERLINHKAGIKAAWAVAASSNRRSNLARSWPRGVRL